MERYLNLVALLTYTAPLWARVVPRLRAVLGHIAFPLAGVALQVAAIAIAWVRVGHAPLDTFEHGLAALSLWVVLGWFYLRRRERMELLSAALLTLAIVLLLAAQVVPSPGYEGETDLAVVWFPLHVTLMITGFLGFTLSCTISTLYLVVRRRLKHRRLKGIGRLPSLDTLDRLNLQAMALGFVALTAGMAVGGLWGGARPEGRLGPDVTTYATLAVWLWYAGGLHVRLVAGWRGRLAAIFSVVGFGGLALMFAVAVVVLQGWHGFGD